MTFTLVFLTKWAVFLKEFNEIYRISDKNVYLRDRIFQALGILPSKTKWQRSYKRVALWISENNP